MKSYLSILLLCTCFMALCSVATAGRSSPGTAPKIEKIQIIAPAIELIQDQALVPATISAAIRSVVTAPADLGNLAGFNALVLKEGKVFKDYEKLFLNSFVPPPLIYFRR